MMNPHSNCNVEPGRIKSSSREMASASVNSRPKLT
jgi:hypothetical protein